MKNVVEEKKKRIRRPKKKKNAMIEGLATQLTASCAVGDSVVTTTNIVTEAVIKIAVQSTPITVVEEIVEIRQQSSNLPRKIAKVNYSWFHWPHVMIIYSKYLRTGRIYQRAKAFTLCYWQFETMALRPVGTDTKLDFVFAQGSPYSSFENTVHASASHLPLPT